MHRATSTEATECYSQRPTTGSSLVAATSSRYPELMNESPGSRRGNAGFAAPTLVLACAAACAATLNGTMVSVALPSIGNEFDLEPAALGWVITAYFLVYGIAIPFHGRLADLYGIRRPFVGGICIFVVGSVLCAAAPGYGTLVGARIVQAAGAAAISGLAPAAISFVYPAGSRGRSLGILSAAVGTSAALGPVVGGVVTDVAGWRYLFVLTAAFGVLIPSALRILPRGVAEGEEGAANRLDWIGGLLFATSIGGALLVLTEGARLGWTSLTVLGYCGVAAAALVTLILKQCITRSPFIPRALLANRAYLTLAFLALSVIGINITMEVALPQLLSEVDGLSASTIGLVLLPGAVSLAIAGLFAGRAVDWLGPALPIRLGAALVAVSLVLFSGYGIGAGAWAAALAMVAVSIGSVVVKVPLTTGVSLVVGRKNLASGLALNEMCYMLGVSIGTALFSATLSARLGAAGSINPLLQGVPQLARETIFAYSDAFLVLALPLVAVLLISFWLPRGSSKI